MANFDPNKYHLFICNFIFLHLHTYFRTTISNFTFRKSPEFIVGMLKLFDLIDGELTLSINGHDAVLHLSWYLSISLNNVLWLSMKRCWIFVCLCNLASFKIWVIGSSIQLLILSWCFFPVAEKTGWKFLSMIDDYFSASSLVWMIYIYLILIFNMLNKLKLLYLLSDL